MDSLVLRLEAATLKLETILSKQNEGSVSNTAHSEEDSSAGSVAVVAYDDFIATHFQPMVPLATTIGGLVQEQVHTINSFIY